MYDFPTRILDCHFIVHYKFRSWYKETASPVNKDIVILFDKSNSMKGSLIDQAKQAVIAVLESLGPNDRVIIHVYNFFFYFFKVVNNIGYMLCQYRSYR